MLIYQPGGPSLDRERALVQDRNLWDSHCTLPSSCWPGRRDGDDDDYDDDDDGGRDGGDGENITGGGDWNDCGGVGGDVDDKNNGDHWDGDDNEAVDGDGDCGDR